MGDDVEEKRIEVNSMSSPIPIEKPIPSPEISATAKTKIPPRPALVAENGVEVFVSPEELQSLAGGGNLRVHKHGSGQYRGQYLCLRPAGKRTDKRPMLASGRPAKLRSYLAGLGIKLCLTHREIAPCAGCAKRKRTASSKASNLRAESLARWARGQNAA